MIAGRCPCGTALELVWRDSDAHLRCIGLRWHHCGEIAEYGAGKKCRPCDRKRLAAWRRRRMQEPAFAEAKRAYQRGWFKAATADPGFVKDHNAAQRVTNARARAKRRVAA